MNFSKAAGYLVSIIAIALLSFVGFRFWQGKKAEVTPPVLSPKPIEVTISPEPKAFPSVTLEVIQIPTDDKKFSYPKTTTVSLPREQADKITVYGGAGKIILGPKGWAGNASISQKGEISVFLYPQEGSPDKGPRLLAVIVPTCLECAKSAGAEYFEAIGQTIKSGLTRNFISPNLFTYTLPNTSDNLEVNGVAYFAGVNENNPAPPFLRLETVLPADQHDLASALISAFIRYHVPKDIK